MSERFADFLTAGDSVDFVTTVNGYPPSDGWTLRYLLVPGKDLATANPLAPVISLAAGAEGDHFRVQQTNVVTSAWTPGKYAWYAIVEQFGARKTVDSDFVEIRADPAQIQVGYDTRTAAQRALDEALAAYATFSESSGRIKEFEIQGRRTVYADKEQITADIQFWRREVEQEQIRERVAKGLGNPRYVGIRFGRA